MEWGLLEEEGDGKWSVETVEKLIEIRGEERKARSLARRVVRLYRYYYRFPVRVPLLRKAMVEMAGPRSIKAPIRKLRRIVSAERELLAKMAAEIPLPSRGRGGRPGVQWPQEWERPEPSTWQKILAAPFDDYYFQTRAGMQYGADFRYTRSASGIWPSDEEIPVEERVLLLMVREISIDYYRTLADVAEKLVRVPGSRVRKAALIPNEAGGTLYVVLKNGAVPQSIEEQELLKEELRQTSMREWMASAVVFVDELPNRDG